MSYQSDDSILITGGTGSLGNALVTLLTQSDSPPRRIVIYSRDEVKQLEMQEKFKAHSNMLRFFIGDIRDTERLRRALNGVNYVVHAAAMKQVPACEYDPIEAVKTNVDGAISVINAVLDTHQPIEVVAVSTDKAVQPLNTYGASKMVAERLFIQANSYAGPAGPRFSCVRYGNVVGSRGSVFEVFKHQAKTGKFTVTDRDMTRFWITLPEAARFVMSAFGVAPGTILVPFLRSSYVIDLLDAMYPKAMWTVTDIRPGEKLHEVLISKAEASRTVRYPDYYRILPEVHPWTDKLYGLGTVTFLNNPRADFFEPIVRSDSSLHIMDMDELRKLVLEWGYGQACV